MLKEEKVLKMYSKHYGRMVRFREDRCNEIGIGVIRLVYFIFFKWTLFELFLIT